MKLNAEVSPTYVLTSSGFSDFHCFPSPTTSHHGHKQLPNKVGQLVTGLSKYNHLVSLSITTWLVKVFAQDVSNYGCKVVRILATIGILATTAYPRFLGRFSSAS